MTPSTPDTYIALKYMTATQLGRVSGEFKADPTDDQPGWFVEAYRKEGYERVLKLTRVSPMGRFTTEETRALWDYVRRVNEAAKGSG